MWTVALTLFSGALPARAHHETAVQQIGSTGAAPSSSGLFQAASRVEVRLAMTWQSFGRLRQARGRYDRAEPPVTVERYALATGVRLASRTRLDLELPAGRVRGQTPGRFGLGDISASLAQELGPFRLGAFGAAPTGHYTVDAVSSVVDVQPDADGDLGIVTYDARASLGSGTWRAGLTAGLLGETGPVTGDLTASLVQPIGRTPDGIQWGSDLWIRGTVSLRPSDRWAVGGGLLGRLHTADRLEGEVGAAAGQPTQLRTSRRRSLAVVGSIGARVATGLVCATRAQMPVVQWVQGIQLAESFTVSAQCTVARNLDRDART